MRLHRERRPGQSLEHLSDAGLQIALPLPLADALLARAAAWHSARAVVLLAAVFAAAVCFVAAVAAVALCAPEDKSSPQSRRGPPC